MSSIVFLTSALFSLSLLMLFEDEPIGREKMKAQLVENTLRIGERFSCTFKRTLRIPDDGKEYPLPPGLGDFPVYRVADYADRVPKTWKKSGYFIPMYQREAMWIRFEGKHWKPNAVKVAIGNVNALDGRKWDLKLKEEPQNYLVVPTQPWLDGIKAGEGYIRQFVAMPLGSGYTVEGQITGKEEIGGLQLAVFEPKPGRFPDSPPMVEEFSARSLMSMTFSGTSAEMGLAAGGKMKQKIYPDPHGIDVWDGNNHCEVVVHIVNSEMFTSITGIEPPPTPVSAKTYTDYGYPWFALYDEHSGDINPTDELKGVKGISDIDKKKGEKSDPADSSIVVPDEQVIKLKKKK